MPWFANMRPIDSNVILRYLLNDNPKMSQQAKSVIEKGDYAKPEIIAEVVCIKRRVPCHADRNPVIYKNTAALNKMYRQSCSRESVFSFDKKVNRHLKQL